MRNIKKPDISTLHGGIGFTGPTTPDIFGNGVNTTGGVLTFTSGSGTSTFATTPEPGSLLLLELVFPDWLCFDAVGCRNPSLPLSRLAD